MGFLFALLEFLGHYAPLSITGFITLIFREILPGSSLAKVNALTEIKKGEGMVLVGHPFEKRCSGGAY
jgi:hypothetical protein